MVGGVAEPQGEATVKILIGWREREGEREGERGRAMEREGGREIERPRARESERERERLSERERERGRESLKTATRDFSVRGENTKT